MVASTSYPRTVSAEKNKPDDAWILSLHRWNLEMKTLYPMLICEAFDPSPPPPAPLVGTNIKYNVEYYARRRSAR